MSKKFNQSFRREAVRKVLSRGDSVTIAKISVELGVAKSSLYRWDDDAKQQKLELSWHDILGANATPKGNTPAKLIVV